MASEPDPLQAQYDGIPVPCYTWRRADDDFVLERANQAAFELGDGHLETLIGMRFAEVYAHRPDIEADLTETLTTRGRVNREMEHSFAASGVTRLLDVTYVFVPPDRVMVHADDITDRRESEERLRAVIATLESGLLTVDDDGNVTDANPAACRILGLERDRILGNREWWRAIAPRLEDGSAMDPVNRTSPGKQVLEGGEPRHAVPVTFTRPDGYRVSISANYQPLRAGTDGRVNGLVVSITDVTESRRLEERVAHQALHDPLTGLPNRLLFQERLEQALARPLRTRVAVLLVGLDRFRAVNDTLGHQAGDDVLIEVAGRLRQVLDVAQPLARFGGDEFAVLAECEDERAAAALAERLAETLASPVKDLTLSATIGIAVEDLGHTSADLIQGADAALQRVKARGGSAFEVFDRAMEGRLRDRLRIEDGLRRAIANDELRLMYQPIWELDPFRVVAVEALVRWQHPEEGLLGPGASCRSPSRTRS